MIYDLAEVKLAEVSPVGFHLLGGLVYGSMSEFATRVHAKRVGHGKDSEEQG